MAKIRGRCLIKGQLVPGELVIRKGLIASITAIPDAQDLPIISPGFIDLQVNGAADRLLNATPETDTIRHIDSALKRLGTTAWLPTVVTDSLGTMQSLADAVAESRGELASILGVHFEGPHINPSKKGVHDRRHIRPVSHEELTVYGRTDLGCRLLTLAPETSSSSQLTELKNLGCILSLGHSAADYDETKAAINDGLQSATHLFNAMTGLDSRKPGAVGAILESDVAYGFILDGEHVHPVMARTAYRRNRNMVLVTDAMPLLASDKTEFEWFGKKIQRKGKRLTDPDGRLAGACISQLDAVQNAMHMLHISLQEALLLATRNPAKLLGVYPHYGDIEIGSRGDLVVLDDDGALLDVWVGGAPVAGVHQDTA